MRRIIVPLLVSTLGSVCLIGLPSIALAQTAADLVGTWANVSNVNVRQDGSKVELFGPHGTGMAIFESNGRYMVINVNPDVPKFASGSRAQGTPDENKAAVAGSIAHYGTYTVADKILTLKIEGSSYPNWRGEEQKRPIALFTGDELKWTTAASVGGTAEVGWKRIK
jgi:hypothetical protein